MALSARRLTSIFRSCILAVLLCATALQAQAPLEGFIPLVGLGLTDEFDDGSGAITFFISDPSSSPGGTRLGTNSNGNAFADIALFDTGAATHILTHEASGANGFDILGNGFDGTNIQPVGGATGIVDLLINDPHGIYAAGLGDRNSNLPSDSPLEIQPQFLRGQKSFATLSAPNPSWELPNIVGMPLAAHHRVHIKNSEPVIFDLNGRTVRTPQIDFIDLGGGGQRPNDINNNQQDDILRRSSLQLTPGISFVQGPIYVFDLGGIGEGNPLYDNPSSPSVIENGGMFIDVDFENGTNALQDGEFLFDTGASLTVISTDTAIDLGIDPILDIPEFTLAVEGSGGVTAGIPGYVVDKLSLSTAGGSFEVTNVPVAVLDVTNPTDPGNIIPGILGMNVFADRDLIIDANPSLGGAGNPPALYISDRVTTDYVWTDTAASGSWFTESNWDQNLIPALDTVNARLADALVNNVSGVNQQAVIPAGQTISTYRATIGGTVGAEMAAIVQGGLLAYADIVVNEGGRLHLDSTATTTAKLNAQFIEVEMGALTGSGEIFVGAGPLDGSLRNNNGLIAPGDPNGNPIGHIDVDGDIANQATIEFDLGGTSPGTFDELTATRNIYLQGELSVNLVDLDGTGIFMPAVGDTFDIINVGDRVTGSFDTTDLPAGFTWDVIYFPRTVQLQVTSLQGLVCDTDGDGDCDITDINAMYAAFGSSGSLDFDGNGTVGAEDIQGWLNAASSPGNPAKLSSADLYKIGDVNLDGDVNSNDLGLLLNNFGSDASLGWGDGNLNGDAFVDSLDLGLMLNEFGHASAAAAVPEPGSVVMLLMGLAMLVVRRRRS